VNEKNHSFFDPMPYWPASPGSLNHWNCFWR
jgi:hypothetical protein